MAVPLGGVYCAGTVWGDALSRVAGEMKGVCLPLPPGAARAGVGTTGGGAGGWATSWLMVGARPAGVAGGGVAGGDKVSVNVSLGSTMVSPRTATSTNLEVSPGANVSVPTVGV